MHNSNDIFPTSVFLGSFRGEISPTVARAFLSNAHWFDKTFKDTEQALFDLEGFDKFGYNSLGKDRSGNTANDYAKNMYYEVNDDHIDAGEEEFLKVLGNYSFEVSHGLYVIVPYCLIQYGNLTPEQDYNVYACNEEGQINYY